MPKSDLISKLDSRIDSLFSEHSLYNDFKQEAIERYKKYCNEKNEDPSFTLLVDFLDENVLKQAVSMSVKETILFLLENNLLRVDD